MLLDVFGCFWTYLDAQARGQTQISQFGLLLKKFIFIGAAVSEEIEFSEWQSSFF